VSYEVVLDPTSLLPTGTSSNHPTSQPFKERQHSQVNEMFLKIFSILLLLLLQGGANQEVRVMSPGRRNICGACLPYLTLTEVFMLRIIGRNQEGSPPTYYYYYHYASCTSSKSYASLRILRYRSCAAVSESSALEGSNLLQTFEIYSISKVLCSIPKCPASQPACSIRHPTRASPKLT